MGFDRQTVLDSFQSHDLIGIGMEADAVRRRLHPEGVISYVVDRSLRCSAPHFEQQAAEAVALGATGIVLRAGEGDIALEEWLPLLDRTRKLYPSLRIHGLSATSVIELASRAGISVRELLARLQGAGLDSLSGDDAGILDEAVQTLEERCSVPDWLETHRTAHSLGMTTTATMLFGVGEAMEHRARHLESLYRLQQETGGFVSFTPRASRPAIGVRGFEEATAVEYLKTLAISRIALDAIPHIQADWATQGLKVLQMALRFGADDVGSVMPSETAEAPDGITEEDLRRVIRGAGFRPMQRDTLYRTAFLT